MAQDERIAPVAHRLERARQLAERRLSPEAERVFAARAEPASAAWIALRDRVASRARVRFEDGSGERELDLPGLREVAVSHESRPRGARPARAGEG